jgi:hypothetical protein
LASFVSELTVKIVGHLKELVLGEDLRFFEGERVGVPDVPQGSEYLFASLRQRLACQRLIDVAAHVERPQDLFFLFDRHAPHVSECPAGAFLPSGHHRLVEFLGGAFEVEVALRFGDVFPHAHRFSDDGVLVGVLHEPFAERAPKTTDAACAGKVSALPRQKKVKVRDAIAGRS